MIWLVLGVVAVALVLIVVVASRRRTPDGVVTFQRQIDALSPEARRPVVQRLEDVTKRGDTQIEDIGPDEAGEARDVDGA